MRIGTDLVVIAERELLKYLETTNKDIIVGSEILDSSFEQRVVTTRFKTIC